MGRIVITGGDGIMGNGEEDNLWRRWRDIENKSLHLVLETEWRRETNRNLGGTWSNVAEPGRTLRALVDPS